MPFLSGLGAVRGSVGPERSPSLSPNVVVLGIVSLLMGMSSAMIYGVLPVFLVTVLGASMASVGVIEGIAEATTSFMKIFSGAISDRLGRRKPLVVLGYALSAFHWRNRFPRFLLPALRTVLERVSATLLATRCSRT